MEQKNSKIYILIVVGMVSALGPFVLVDFSSGKADANTYGIAYSDENGKFVYVIEPNDNLLKCMKSAAPRKVMIEQNITAKN